MDVTAREIDSKNSRAVKEIYLSAFSKEERMPFWMMRLMAKLPNTRFLSFQEGERVCGFLYMALSRSMLYILFFAVEEGLRSMGNGGRILEKVQSMYPGRTVIVSIERCDAEAENADARRRRKKFYQENAFLETGYFVKLAGIEQELLIKNGDFSKMEFRLFLMKYSFGTLYPKIWSKKVA